MVGTVNMMINKLKEQIKEARKAQNGVKRDILSLILGESQTIEAREGKITDEQVYSLVRKTIEANNEIIAINDNELCKLQNQVLNELLPKYLTVQELRQKIDGGLYHEVIACKTEGQGIGIIMKYCKSKGINVLGETVKEVVKQIMGSN